MQFEDIQYYYVPQQAISALKCVKKCRFTRFTRFLNVIGNIGRCCKIEGLRVRTLMECKQRHKDSDPNYS